MSQRLPTLQNSRPNPIIAGAVGGLAGTLAMSRFQRAWRRISQNKRQQQQLCIRRAPEPTDEEGSAEILSRVATLAGIRVRDKSLKRGGVAVHYGFGVAAGALYGALQRGRAEPLQARTVLKGALFGAALFLAAEEALKLTLRFSPQQSLLGSRKYAVASHVVYGASMAVMSEWIRQSL